MLYLNQLFTDFNSFKEYKKNASAITTNALINYIKYSKVENCRKLYQTSYTEHLRRYFSNQVRLTSYLWDSLETIFSSRGNEYDFKTFMFETPTRSIYIRVPETMRVENGGICLDGDTKSIRYIRPTDGRVYKMKSGKFLKACLTDTGFVKVYGEKATNYMIELFCAEWNIFASAQIGVYSDTQLQIDTNFNRIYSSVYYGGRDFGSCMTNRGYESFYTDAVSARAAGLWRGDILLARCIIYDDVTDNDTGTKYRLAERQYSANSDDMLKRVLINKLIEANEIDGYKKIGSGCGDAKAFVTNNGVSLDDCVLYIGVNIDDCKYISYQDSFKWFNRYGEKAYNDSRCSYEHTLDVTDGGEDIINGVPENYDGFRDDYTNDDVTDVYIWDGYHWRETETTYYNRDSYFIYVDFLGAYYQSDECDSCDLTNDNVPREYETQHNEYYGVNYDEYLEVDTLDELITVFEFSEYHNEYVEILTTRNTINELFTEINGEYYDKVGYIEIDGIKTPVLLTDSRLLEQLQQTA